MSPPAEVQVTRIHRVELSSSGDPTVGQLRAFLRELDDLCADDNETVRVFTLGRARQLSVEMKTKGDTDMPNR